MEAHFGTSQMVSKLQFGQPKGIKGRSIIKVKKIDYGPRVFQHLLHKFEEKEVMLEDRTKLIWYLGEKHVNRMSRKLGRPRTPISDPAHKTLPKIEILLQIYQSMAEEFRQDVTFHTYQDLLGYGEAVWDGHLHGKEDGKLGLREAENSPKMTKEPHKPTWDANEGFKEDAALAKKKKSKRKLSLRPGTMANRLEAVPEAISMKCMNAIIKQRDNEFINVSDRYNELSRSIQLDVNI